MTFQYGDHDFLGWACIQLKPLPIDRVLDLWLPLGSEIPDSHEAAALAAATGLSAAMSSAAKAAIQHHPVLTDGHAGHHHFHSFGEAGAVRIRVRLTTVAALNRRRMAALTSKMVSLC